MLIFMHYAQHCAIDILAMLRLLYTVVLIAIGAGAVMSGASFWRQPAPGTAIIIILLCALVASAFWVLWLRWRNPAQTIAMRQAGAAGSIEHTWVRYDQISPALRLAAIIAEDLYFPLHCGFDWQSMYQAFQRNRQAGADTLRGGSTISQQVAKNVFLWPAQSYLRKAIEAWFTLLIETLWPKRRILEVYLNVAQFGPRTFGVEAAAQRFCSKPAQALAPHEAALLAAVLPNPIWIYRADAPSPQVRFRQAMIMNGMKKAGDRYLEKIEAKR
jgi:monofunctional biosynthetic peptidoglycan transglycosylase